MQAMIGFAHRKGQPWISGSVVDYRVFPLRAIWIQHSDVLCLQQPNNLPE